MALVRPLRSPAACTALLAATLVLPAFPVEADGVSSTLGWLPTARWESAGAWINGRAYFAGGHDGTRMFDDVLVYDPVTGGEAKPASCKLVHPTIRMGSATDGRHLYLFGGITSYSGAPESQTDVVQRVTPHPTNPFACSVTVVGTMQWRLSGVAAAWSGDQFYLFGGADWSANPTRFIQRFDPNSGSSQILSTDMWPPMTRAAAVWSGGAAYLLGGERGAPMSGVYRFNPAASALTPVLDLPSPRAWAPAVAVGEHIVLFGGAQSGPAVTDEVLRIHPASKEVVVMSAKLPTPRGAVALAWDGARAHVAGGFRFDTTTRGVSQVATFEFVPPPPAAVVAVSGPSPGEITLTWTPPPANTYLTLSGYRVLRSTIKDATPAQSVAFDVPVGSSFVDYDLVPGIRYWYRLAAVSPQGASPFTDQVDARAAVLPQTPTILGVRPIADGDGDGLVDAAERTVCDGGAIEAIVNGLGAPFPSRCTGGDLANLNADSDDDGVPTRAEPILCSLTLPSDTRRGVCNGQDYGITPSRWSELVGYPDLPLA